MRLQSARGVNRVTPEVISELALPYYTSDQRSCVNSDPELKLMTIVSRCIRVVTDAKCKIGDCFDVIRPGDGHPRGDHILISDGFDFLEAEGANKPVQISEHSAQQRDKGLRSELGRQRREPDHIGKKHGRFFVVVGDLGVILLEPDGDLLRQHIPEKPIRLVLKSIALAYEVGNDRKGQSRPSQAA